MPMKKYKPGQIVMLSAASFFLAFVVSVSRPLLALIVDQGRKAEETMINIQEKIFPIISVLSYLSFAFSFAQTCCGPSCGGESPPDGLLVRMGEADGPVPEEGPGKPGLNSSGAGPVQESPVKSKRFVSDLI